MASPNVDPSRGGKAIPILTLLQSSAALDGGDRIVRMFAGGARGVVGAVWPTATRASARDSTALEAAAVDALRAAPESETDGHLGLPPHQRACRVVSTATQRVDTIAASVLRPRAAMERPLVPEFTIVDIAPDPRVESHDETRSTIVMVDLDRGLLIVDRAPEAAIVAEAMTDLLAMLYLLDGVLPVTGELDRTPGRPRTLTLAQRCERYAWGPAGIAPLDDAPGTSSWAPHPDRVVLPPASISQSDRQTVTHDEATVHFALRAGTEDHLAAAALTRAGLFRRRLADALPVVELCPATPTYMRPRLRLLPGGADGSRGGACQ